MALNAIDGEARCFFFDANGKVFADVRGKCLRCGAENIYQARMMQMCQILFTPTQIIKAREFFAKFGSKD